MAAPEAAAPARGRYVPPPGSIPTLDVPDPTAWRRLHLVGVGGAGMSGIARLLVARGIEVTGSDLKDSLGLASLRAAGATLFVGHREDQIGSPDAVVISSAIPPGNVEVRAARRRGVPVLRRAQVLAALMRDRRTVAIAGTHGKTTTTSMVAVVLERAGLAPTYVIGGELNESGSGASHGAGEVFVAEADESDGSFLLLEPHVGVVTNVDEDHLDFYRGGREEIEAAFEAFVARCGVVVACWDDAGARRAVEGTGVRVIRYGVGDGVDLTVDEDPRSATRDGRGASGRLRGDGFSVDVTLAVPGRHNLLNAAAALAVAVELGISPQAAAEGLAAFTGTRRRFDRRGSAAGVTFVDDYAHHPTEVEATLRAAPRNGGRLVAVFQPHRYTRTQAMWRALGESLAGADLVVVTEVYGAGEQPIPGVSAKLVVDALAESAPGKRVVYLPHRAEVASFLAHEVREGDLVLTLGAGDVTMVGDETMARLGGGGA